MRQHFADGDNVKVHGTQRGAHGQDAASRPTINFLTYLYNQIYAVVFAQLGQYNREPYSKICVQGREKAVNQCSGFTPDYPYPFSFAQGIISR